MKLSKAAGLAAAAFAMAAPAAAQERGWVMIGRAQADGSSGTGTLEARQIEPFREIMICVNGAPVRFDQVGVRLRDGSSIDIRLRTRIGEGGCSRFLPLRGRRDIAGMNFTYDAASLGGGTARVELFAR